MTAKQNKKFLFLQGPHGPVFDRLGKMLRSAGCDVLRVGFNAGDQSFWRDKASYVPFTGTIDDWPARCRSLIQDQGVTDLILYGDTRPVHAQAIKIARELGVAIHVFEEGYLRPFWVTYERDGSNGHSRLMDMDVADMRRALEASNLDVPEAPAHWGDMYQHVFYGFAYHLMILIGNRKYKAMQTHRDIPVSTEFWISLQRILLTPFIKLRRNIVTQVIQRGGYPYHLVLMQLEHDSAFQMHSPFSKMSEFLEVVIKGFAEGAPSHHKLVFKAHPLESGRRPLRKIMRRLAKKHGVEDRVYYVPGGKLAKLLDHARTAVTVNSTAAQQVLWRGIPLKIFGAAVYDKPEFVSTKPIAEFFSNPTRPDNLAYQDYRRYLLETSQVVGGFYSARGRTQLLRQVADMILSRRDPYEGFEAGDLGPRQDRKPHQLRLVN